MLKAGAKMTGAKAAVDMITKYGVYFIFLLAVVFFALTTDTFFTLSNASNVLQQAAPLGIAVIGMVFVLSIASTDISLGQVMHLTAVVVGYTILKFKESGFLSNPWAIVVIWIIGIAVGCVFGAFNGLLIAKLNLVPFIATLATMSIARGIALTISQSKTFYIHELAPVAKWTLGEMKFPGILIIQLALLAVFSFVFYRTPFGRQVNATGNDEKAAKNIGIKTVKVKFLAHFICGFTASLGAMLLGGQMEMAYPSFAYGNEFLVISGAVLGGTSLYGGRGNMFPGALIGIILVQTIMNGLTMLSASPYIYTIVKGLIIFVAVIIDSIKYKGELR